MRISLGQKMHFPGHGNGFVKTATDWIPDCERIGFKRILRRFSGAALGRFPVPASSRKTRIIVSWAKEQSWRLLSARRPVLSTSWHLETSVCANTDSRSEWMSVRSSGGSVELASYTSGTGILYLVWWFLPHGFIRVHFAYSKLQIIGKNHQTK